MLKIDTLQDKLEACQLEKKYFETFMIESRKENKDLKEQIHKGDKETIEKIKQIAKNEAATRRNQADLEKIVTFQVPDKGQSFAPESPLLAKNYSSSMEGQGPKFSQKYFTGPPDATSKVFNTNLDM